MSTSTNTTRTEHRALDFPHIEGYSYPRNQPTIPHLLVIFLFKLSAPRRNEIIEQIKRCDGKPWPEGVSRMELDALPWLRSFNMSADHDLYIPRGLDMVIDRELLREGKCIIAHRLDIRDLPANDDAREFAIVPIEEAYKLVCSASATKSWFPSTFPWKCEFQPIREPEPKTSTIGYNSVDLPVFIVLPITKEQETYLFALLTCETAQPEFFHIPNTCADLDDIDHLMQNFLENSLFPAEFVVVNKETVATIPNPIPTLSDELPYIDFSPPHPTFTLATELLFRHHTSDYQAIAYDNLGYAVGQREMEDGQEYQMWCGNIFRGMGLGSWIGTVDGEADDVENYYWDCWLDHDGRVDGQVRAEASVKR